MNLTDDAGMLWQCSGYFGLNEDVQSGNQPDLFRPTELNIMRASGWFNTRLFVLDQDQHVDRYTLFGSAIVR